MDRVSRSRTPKQPSEVTDFLSWLQREYVSRRQKNPAYSIRSFSSYLQVSPATVSHLLSGKRTPSVKFAEKLFQKLNIAPNERKLVLSSLGKSSRTSRQANESKYHLVALDSFKVLSDWYHYAIIELLAVEGFRFDYSWIAGQLEISVTETRQAIERLLRLDLIEEKDGTLVNTHGSLTNGDDVLTSSAHKTLQRHVLQKALDAIDNTAIDEKDISSMTMAIDVRKILQAKAIITKFRRELCDFLENGNQTRVYNLGIQLYPVSKGMKK